MGRNSRRTLRSVAISAAGHLAVLLLAVLLAGSTGARPVPGGGDAVTVEMVTLREPRPEPAEQEEHNAPEEAAEQPVEEVAEQPVEVDEPGELMEEPPEETEEPSEEVEEPAEQVPEPSYSGVGASGEAAGEVPGPATYESRVFGAIRRHFRTSIRPEQSYRIVFTVNPDGTTGWEVVRSSGTAAFDRAVEHALAMANVPPPPPGRTRPTIVRIEFLGPDSD
jgi:TonB family protein